MPWYGGIDLGARRAQVCVIDENQEICVQREVPNSLSIILELLQPYRGELEVVVESTFNWYWLIDGLQDAGIKTILAHTLGLFMITRAKVKTDRRDALTLARLLRAGVIPQGYVYPKAERPLRQLLRRRQVLVRLRAGERAGLRRLLLAHGILDHSRHGMTTATHQDLKAWFEHPLTQFEAGQRLERVSLYSQQIDELEQILQGELTATEDFHRLLTLPGVGRTLGATIMLEIGDIDRFPNAKHFSSYCRVVPGTADSGSVSKKGRGNKQGNAHLKNAFSQAAVHAVRGYPKIRKYFERQLRRRKGRGAKPISYGIVAHKLVLAAYHILKDETVYREEMLFG